MAIDRIRPLKFETPVEGGTEVDYLPTESDPQEDYADLKGIVFDSVSGNRIEGVSGQQVFYDTASGNTSGWTLKDLAQRLYGKNVKFGTPNDGDVLIWNGTTQIWEFNASLVLRMKSGRVQAASFSGNPKKATVTFGSPFSTSGYGINITGGNARSWTYESKTVSGFVINANANQALTNEASWQATADGETA